MSRHVHTRKLGNHAMQSHNASSTEAGMQAGLIKEGYYCGEDEADLWVFGDQTHSALLTFQVGYPECPPRRREGAFQARTQFVISAPIGIPPIIADAGNVGSAPETRLLFFGCLQQGGGGCRLPGVRRAARDGRGGQGDVGGAAGAGAGAPSSAGWGRGGGGGRSASRRASAAAVAAASSAAARLGRPLHRGRQWWVLPPLNGRGQQDSSPSSSSFTSPVADLLGFAL